MSNLPNRRGAPPPDSLLPSKQIECPAVFWALTFAGLLTLAAVFWFAWVIS